MRPPITLMQIQSATVDEERHRGEDERHARHRGMLEMRDARSSFPTRLEAAVMRVIRRERHSLTSYACRLPNGKIGRVAILLRGSDWTLVCQVA